MSSVLTRDIAKTTTFRLTLAFGAAFGVAILLLLGLVYLETAGVLSRRVDHVIQAEASALARTSPDVIVGLINQEALRDPLVSFSVFSAEGERVAGFGYLTPQNLPLDGRLHDFPRRGETPPQRAMADRLPWGEILIVQRDTTQLVAFRMIILDALGLSGAIIAAFGVVLAVTLSLPPLRRVQATRRATEAIAQGDLAVRLPVNGSGDELDELAQVVNAMLPEVERLVTQARTVGEGVAHELRTPLTRLRATLDHVGALFEPDDPRRSLFDKCVAEADGVLARFRALLRIAAVEARGRQSGIEPMSLSETLDQVVELYAPLAAERGINLQSMITPAVVITADPELMFEAFSNLIDNALKFTSTGGQVRVSLVSTALGPAVEIQDNGSGIALAERLLVTKRFYRSQDVANVPGHGLGLSLVSAVADLHGFAFSIHDAQPGVIVHLLCRSSLTVSAQPT